jgi:hypothetical protein
MKQPYRPNAQELERIIVRMTQGEKVRVTAPLAKYILLNHDVVFRAGVGGRTKSKSIGAGVYEVFCDL